MNKRHSPEEFGVYANQAHMLSAAVLVNEVRVSSLRGDFEILNQAGFERLVADAAVAVQGLCTVVICSNPDGVVQFINPGVGAQVFDRNSHTDGRREQLVHSFNSGQIPLLLTGETREYLRDLRPDCLLLARRIQPQSLLRDILHLLDYPNRLAEIIPLNPDAIGQTCFSLQGLRPGRRATVRQAQDYGFRSEIFPRYIADGFDNFEDRPIKSLVSTLYITAPKVDAPVRATVEAKPPPPRSLPVHLIPAMAISQRVHIYHSNTQRILQDFPKEEHQLAGKGGKATLYAWDALRYTEDYVQTSRIGQLPEDAVPIVWELLPDGTRPATPEEESYARALQILLIEPKRLPDFAAIMSPQSALQFAWTVYETHNDMLPLPPPRPLEAIVPPPVVAQEPVVPPAPQTQVALPPSPTPTTPESAVLAQPELVIAPEPLQELTPKTPTVKPAPPPSAKPATEEAPPDDGSITISQYTAQFNEANPQEDEKTFNDEEMLQAIYAADAETQEKNGVLSLTAAGEQQMSNYFMQLFPAPQDWVRVRHITDAVPNVGFRTVMQHLQTRDSGWGNYNAPGSLVAVCFIDPAVADKLIAYFKQRQATQPPEPRPSPQPSRSQPRRQAPPVAQAPAAAPKLTVKGLLNSRQPVNLDTLVAKSRLPYATVARAIAAAQKELGPKLDIYIDTDRQGRQVAHYRGRPTIQAILKALDEQADEE